MSAEDRPKTDLKAGGDDLPLISEPKTIVLTKQKSREAKLVMVILILVVSWLVVKVWCDVFDTVSAKYLKLEGSLWKQLIFAVIFTIVIVYAVIKLDIDDMMSSS